MKKRGSSWIYIGIGAAIILLVIVWGVRMANDRAFTSSQLHEHLPATVSETKTVSART